MKLTDGEKQTPLWARLKKHLADELEVARSKLESPQITHDQSLLVRGDIMRIRKMLDMDKQDIAISPHR